MSDAGLAYNAVIRWHISRYFSLTGIMVCIILYKYYNVQLNHINYYLLYNTMKPL